MLPHTVNHQQLLQAQEEYRTKFNKQRPIMLLQCNCYFCSEKYDRHMRYAIFLDTVQMKKNQKDFCRK